jgi:hypothetical protein
VVDCAMVKEVGYSAVVELAVLAGAYVFALMNASRMCWTKSEYAITVYFMLGAGPLLVMTSES